MAEEEWRKIEKSNIFGFLDFDPIWLVVVRFFALIIHWRNKLTKKNSFCVVSNLLIHLESQIDDQNLCHPKIICNSLDIFYLPCEYETECEEFVAHDYAINRKLPAARLLNVVDSNVCTHGDMNLNL